MLDWNAAARIARESGAVDVVMLTSYLVHATSPKHAKENIKSIKQRCPEIWERIAPKVR